MPESKDLKKAWSNLNPIYKIAAAVYLAIMVAIIIVVYWGQVYYMEPNRTFWAMINNNLATNGVVKSTTQDSNNVKIQTANRLSFSPSTQLHSIRKIDDGSTSPPSKLTLETLGNPDADYQRYSHIERALQNGKKLDYSAVYPLWILTSSSGRSPQQLNNSLFGLMLFGNLPPGSRTQLGQALGSAYEPHFVKKSEQAGRRVYTYNVNLKMRAYMTALKKYAEIIGSKSAQNINPSSYSENTEIALSVEIDALSRQLISVQNVSAKSQPEKYSSYGIAGWQKAPQKTASLADLQNAIQAATP